MMVVAASAVPARLAAPATVRHAQQRRATNFRTVRRTLAATAPAAAPPVTAAATAAPAATFFKYQGLGNDFVLIDNRDSATIRLSAARCAEICDRNFGIGADGVIFAMPPGLVQDDEDYSMRMYNSDGSEPEMCGNGIRCLANFVAMVDGAAPRAYKVGTLAGLIQPEVRADGQVAVDMGEPVLEPAKVPCTLEVTQDGAAVRAPMEVNGETWLVTAVSMGNPHCVTFGKKSECDVGGIVVGEMDLAAIGPAFEAHPCFTAKTNTEFTEARGVRFRFRHSRCRVQGSGYEPLGAGSRVQGIRHRVQGSGSKVHV